MLRLQEFVGLLRQSEGLSRTTMVRMVAVSSLPPATGYLRPRHRSIGTQQRIRLITRHNNTNPPSRNQNRSPHEPRRNSVQ